MLDASAAVELVLSTPAGEVISERIDDPEVTLHAPYLIDAEVTQVMRRLVSAGSVDGPRAWEALVDFVALGVVRYAHEFLLPRVWELRENATAYDALYVALAELLGAPLLTTDGRLAGIPAIDATIEVIT